MARPMASSVRKVKTAVEAKKAAEGASKNETPETPKNPEGTTASGVERKRRRVLNKSGRRAMREKYDENSQGGMTMLDYDGIGF